MTWRRAGLVLPDGTLFGEGVKTRIKEALLTDRIDQIKAGNFNLDLKNRHNPDTGPGDVDSPLPEYEKLRTQIAETWAKLKAQLMEALSR
jgi:type I restriction enzyme M protein